MRALAARAIEFALRHPAGSSTRPRLVRAAALKSPPRMARPLMSAAARSDRMFWLFAHLFPRTLHGLMGVPAGYQPTADETATIEAVATSIFPVHLRREGFVYDAFVGNPAVRHAPLEQLKVPTLLVHSADDSLAPYAHAEAAAARIPGVEFVTLEEGWPPVPEPRTRCSRRRHVPLAQRQRLRRVTGARRW